MKWRNPPYLNRLPIQPFFVPPRGLPVDNGERERVPVTGAHFERPPATERISFFSRFFSPRRLKEVGKTLEKITPGETREAKGARGARGEASVRGCGGGGGECRVAGVRGCGRQRGREGGREGGMVPPCMVACAGGQSNATLPTQLADRLKTKSSGSCQANTLLRGRVEAEPVKGLWVEGLWASLGLHVFTSLRERVDF